MQSLSANDVTSDCFDHFGHEKFDKKRVDSERRDQCPINECTSPLIEVVYGKKDSKLRYCPEHGLRLHSNTFVYWNGLEHRDEARLRNFRIRPDLARKFLFDGTGKVETGRLGHEMSEDALSWNVFVGLAGAGKLRETVQFLTDKPVASEPELYLWGERIDLDGNPGRRFPPLAAVRARLEPYGGRFKTEPDIMLVVEGEVVVCIEAKFESENPRARVRKVKRGEKLAVRASLLDRYLDKSSDKTKASIDRSNIDEKKIHSQLFRNLVFASEMADESNWYVINLANNARRKTRRHAQKDSVVQVEKQVRCYLTDDYQHCFSCRTWEALHRGLISGNRALGELDSYLRSKSAHFLPAFDLA